MTDSGTLRRDKPVGLGGRSPTADPSVAAPAGAAVSGQDVLLATKLHVPGPQPGFVPRPRLVEALGEGLARGRMLVCAPAGFGKTALLADWARGGGHPVAWLGLDGGDSDPARFWRHAVAALDRARPGLAGRVGPPPPGSLAGLVTALINELAADPGPDEVLLVLDDYHLVGSGPVHESVAFLLENLPPGLRVVVSSRADPPLPLARLRARGQLAELRAADLRFTAEEAAALLGEAAGPGLPAAAAAALVARTEGWAAGLQLAGLSLRGHADPAGFVAAFSGSHRFVLDYLADEVLDGQPGQVRAFLLETSVLERLSGSCVMRSPAGPAARRCWPTSSGRACSWCRWMRCAAGGATTTCSPICCAPGCRLSSPAGCRRCTGPRPPGARSMTWPMTRCGTRWRPGTRPGRRGWWSGTSRTLLGRSEGVTLRRWLSALPAESVRDRPRLCLAQAYAAAQGFQLEALEALLDDAERGFAVSGGEPYHDPAGRPASVLANVPAGIAFLRASLARLRGDAALAARYNRQALAQLGEDEWLMRSFVRWNRGGGGLAGRPARASRARPGRGARRAAGRRRAVRWLSPHARLVRPGRGAARPGQLGCGAGDLPASAGHLRREQPDSPHGSGARGPGPGLVRAERADRRP